MAGQPCPLGRGRAGRPSDERSASSRPAFRRAAPRAGAGRDDDASRIGRRRVLQLDLDADDRPDPRLLRRGGETHDAVQPVVVGDREPGEAQLGRPLGHVLDGRGPVEEREVGVAVELGVGRSLPVWCSGGGRRGQLVIEQMFYFVIRKLVRMYA